VKITNIHVANFTNDGARASINWNEGEFRFHAWINTETLEIEVGGAGISRKPTIYKNPVNSDGKHRTIYLDATAKKNVAILAHVIHNIKLHDLMSAGRKQHAADEAAEDARRKQQEIEYRRAEFRKLFIAMSCRDRDEMINIIAENIALRDIDELQARFP
jgi:hypothetical protein